MGATKARGSKARLTALVTGASRGIGRETAQRLAARGVRVAIHYRNDQKAAETLRKALPGQGHFLIAADLAEPDGAERLFSLATAKAERLHILVNCAGIFEEHPIGAVTFADWKTAWTRTMAINLFAPTHLTFLAAEHMVKQGGGRIVNLSSRGAYGGQSRTAAYSASKAALNSMSQSFARTVAKDGVLVYVVAPSWVDTDMAAAFIHGANEAAVRSNIPLGRVTTPQEVADTVTWLALDAPAAMTGAIVDINGAVHLRH